MPISTPTQLNIFGIINTSTTTLTSSSMTPTANALLLVSVAHRWSDGAGPAYVSSISSTFGTVGGWTIVAGNSSVNNAEEFGSADARSVWAWAIANSSPGSGTVTVTLTNAHAQGKGFRTIQIESGFDTTTPILQTKVVGSGSTVDTLSGDFDSTPLSSSMLLMGSVASAATAGVQSAASGWTAFGDSAYLHTLRHGTQYRTSTTSTTFGVSWTATAANGIALNALEIAAESSSGGHAKLSGKLGYPLRGKLG